MAEIIDLKTSREKKLKAKARKAARAKKKPHQEPGEAFQNLLSQLLGGGSIDPAAIEGIMASTQAVQLRETPTELHVLFNMQGLLKEELRLRISNNQLTVDILQSQDDSKTIIDPSKIKPENAPKALSQSLPLPLPVEAAGAKAEFKDGELKVILKKKQKPQAPSFDIPID